MNSRAKALFLALQLRFLLAGRAQNLMAGKQGLAGVVK